MMRGGLQVGYAVRDTRREKNKTKQKEQKAREVKKSFVSVRRRWLRGNHAGSFSFLWVQHQLTGSAGSEESASALPFSHPGARWELFDTFTRPGERLSAGDGSIKSD